ncbi:Warthog protein [Seminavis robusta]|uniref:Warthog protein n=1 Tax=Seminavis robusta TaxID=568900 RepID=A0A9N8H2A8_9STRA|nr:Warthog protein [Seminavis robusta]|eukprot:Sro32_g020980.1 Warthog protein (463) ;mRNA; r:123496-124884
MNFRFPIALLWPLIVPLTVAADVVTKQVDGSSFTPRDLQDPGDFDTVVIGSDSQTITVTIDKTAVSGLVTYGEKYVIITPSVSGSDTRVTCTATLASSLVNMQFFLRKFLQPDEDQNGNAQDYDCAANGDNNFVEPDVESCSVTNFPDIGRDMIFGYVAVLDSSLAQGATYSINFVCNKVEPGGSACFSKDSTVDVLDKGSTPMKDLANGDTILVGGGSYEPIYSFAHLDKTKSATFLQVHTNDQEDAPLEVTEEHLVHANGKYVPAGELQIGDILTAANSNEKRIITKLESIVKTGLYAPLTASGTLIVNDVTASAYVSLQGSSVSGGNLLLGHGKINSEISYHFISHLALSPIRMACMGVSSSFCSMPNDEEDKSQHDGYAPFVRIWFDLVQLFESQTSTAVQIFLLAAFLGVVSPLYLIESVFGAALAPSAIFIVMTFISLAANKRQTSNDTVRKVKTV